MRMLYSMIAMAALALPAGARAQSAPPAPQRPARAGQQPPPATEEPSEQLMARSLEELRRVQANLPQQQPNSPYIELSPQPQQMEKAAWLGVSVSPAPDALRHQLRLRQGTGLVVDFVEPKSPAHQAGLKQYDVLQKIDDQILINAEQFSVLVRLYKPSTEIKITLLHDGETQTISVKLAERELPKLSVMFFGPGGISGSGGAGGVTVAPGIAPAPRPQEIAPPIPSGAGTMGLVAPEDSLTWLDGQHQITVTRKNGHRTLVVTNRQGKLIFEGPIDTEQQRSALPQDIRDTLQRLRFWSKPRQGNDSRPPKTSETEPKPESPGGETPKDAPKER